MFNSGPNSVACVDVTKMNRTELEAWCQSLSARLIECSLDVGTYADMTYRNLFFSRCSLSSTHLNWISFSCCDRRMEV